MTLSKYTPHNGVAGNRLQANVGAFTASQQFTLSGWFRRKGAENTSTVYLMGRSLGAAGDQKGYFVQHTNATTDPAVSQGLIFVITSGITGAYKQLTGRYLEVGNWHHLAFVKRGTGNASTLEMYVDGMRSEETIGNVGTLGEIADAAAAFRVFGSPDGAQAAQWDMSRLQVWNTDLSAAQILELFNNARAIDASGVSFAANLANEWAGDPNGSWPNVPAIVGGTALVAQGTWAAAADPVTNFSPPDHIGLRFAYNKTSAAQYTAVGLTAAYNAGTNEIDLTNPIVALENSYIKASGKHTCAENFLMRVVLRVSTTFIGGVGLITDEGARNKVSLCVAHNVNSVPGWLSIYTCERDLLDNISARANSTNGTDANVAGDLIEYTIRRRQNTIIATCRNLTNPTARPLAYVKHTATNTIVEGAWDHPVATAVPAVWCIVGTASLVSQEMWNLDVKGGKYLALGDSITAGVAAPLYSDSWLAKSRAYLAADRPAYGGSLAASSGGGDAIATVDLKIDSGEIESYAGPGGITLLLPIGGNDMGSASAVSQAAHEALMTRLNGLAYVNEVILLYVTPMGSNANIPTFNTYLAGRSERKVNTNTPFLAAASTVTLNAAYGSGDGTHLNAAGFTLYANTIRAALAPVEAPAIASAEAFGTAAITAGAAVAPSAIASAEAFGTAALALGIAATGVASAEAFGSSTVSASSGLAPAGIASAEAFGAASVLSTGQISPSAIASAEAFGTASVTAAAALGPASIASSEAFGAATVAVAVVAAASIPAVSGPRILVSIAPLPRTRLTLASAPRRIREMTGIASAEAFGSITVSASSGLAPAGIASAEAFGAAALAAGAVLAPSAIASAEAFGVAMVKDLASESRILALAPYSFVEADYYSVDGVSGKVAAFLDKVTAGTGIKAIDPTHAFSQSSSALQVALPTTDALLSGRLAAVFTGSQIYNSSAAASAWRCIQDGVGVEWFLAINRTGVTGDRFLLATGNGGAATSMFLRQNGTAVSTVQTDGAIQTFSMAGAAATTGAHYYNSSFRYTDSPKAVFRDRTTQTATSDAANPPNTGDPFGPLTIGGLVGSASMYANFGSLIVFNRVLSPADRNTVQSYIAAKYGVT